MLGITGTNTAFASPDVRFVYFYSPAVLPADGLGLLVVEHRPNLFEHAPRRLVGHARLALNLLRRNSAARLRHQVDRVEPCGKRSGRLVENRASGRVNVMTATVARVRRTAHDAMMLGYCFALLAINTVRIKAIAEPLQTGRIIGKLCLEVPERVGLHGRFAVAHSDYLQ